MLFEHRILDQVSRSAVAPVADTDDDEAHAGFFDLVPVQPGLILGHVDAKGHIVLFNAVGIEIIQLAVNGAQTSDLFVGVLRVVVGLAVLGAPAGVGRFLFLILGAEQPVEQPTEKAVFIGQVDALRFGILQRAGIQRLLDLLRGQQYAVLRGVLAGGVVLGGVVRCGSLRVLRGQLRGLFQQYGRGVLLFQCGILSGLYRRFRCFNSFFRCSRCNFGGFRFFRLRRGGLSLLRGAFRCLFRDVGRALRCWSRVSRCRAACLRCLGGNMGHDRTHGQSFRLCRQQGRCPCAAHSQNQRHGQRCNGCHRLAAGCAGSVKSLFHLSSLPPNLPVVQRCAAPGLCPLPGAGLLLFHTAHGFRIKRTADDNFTLPLVYTRTRGAVNGTAGFYTNSPPGQCVGKCSKWNTFRQGRTLHKAEISHFFQQPLAVLTGV